MWLSVIKLIILSYSFRFNIYYYCFLIFNFKWFLWMIFISFKLIVEDNNGYLAIKYIYQVRETHLYLKYTFNSVKFLSSVIIGLLLQAIWVHPLTLHGKPSSIHERKFLWICCLLSLFLFHLTRSNLLSPAHSIPANTPFPSHYHSPRSCKHSIFLSSSPLFILFFSFPFPMLLLLSSFHRSDWENVTSSRENSVVASESTKW